MCNGRLEALGKGMEIAAAGALSSRRLKAAQLVATDRIHEEMVGLRGIKYISGSNLVSDEKVHHVFDYLTSAFNSFRCT